MSAELMVGAKGFFIVAIAVIVSIVLVFASLVVLILFSGWLLLRAAVVLKAGFWLPLCFLLFKFSIVLKEVIDVFGCGV
jgi:hypothetical protein